MSTLKKIAICTVRKTEKYVASPSYNYTMKLHIHSDTAHSAGHVAYACLAGIKKYRCRHAARRRLSVAEAQQAMNFNEMSREISGEGGTALFLTQNARRRKFARYSIAQQY
jgi:hypothetical protein